MQEKNMGHICPIGRSWVKQHITYTCSRASDLKNISFIHVPELVIQQYISYTCSRASDLNNISLIHVPELVI